MSPHHSGCDKKKTAATTPKKSHSSGTWMAHGEVLLKPQAPQQEAQDA